ncbi:FAD:protein FMN transferase [bacterium]|nr:FAD:protein FMN transferase [bacterium]
MKNPIQKQSKMRDMNASRRDFIKHTARLAFGGLILKAVPSFSANPNPFLVQRAFYTMGTVVTVSAYGTSAKDLHNAITKAREEFQRIDALMSVYRPDSHVSRINRFAGKKDVHVDGSVMDVLISAKQFHKDTQGAFNICVEPMMRLWGFRDNARTLCRLPADRDVYRALEAVSIHHLVISEREKAAGLSNKDAAIDLGGIAVGYSVDRAAAILKSEGVENFLINHSGDIMAIGSPPDQNGWTIGIPDPQNPSEIMKSFSITNQAVSTSGNYESFVVCNDKNFGHILSPETGYPCDRLLSFTAVCSTAIEADAYSTAYFCNGKLPAGIAHVAVTTDSKIVISDTI